MPELRALSEWAVAAVAAVLLATAAWGVWFWRSGRLRGWWGEKRFAWGLRLGLGPGYRMRHGVLLRAGAGSTEIDHVVASVHGIFVIETKNKGGRIEASGGREWVQQIGRRVHRFHSPIEQNEGHVRALRGAMGLPQHAFVAIAAFIGGSEFVSRPPAGVTESIGETVRLIKGRRRKVLTKEELRRALERLDERRLADTFMNRRRHRRHVRRRAAEGKAEGQ